MVRRNGRGVHQLGPIGQHLDARRRLAADDRPARPAAERIGMHARQPIERIAQGSLAAQQQLIAFQHRRWRRHAVEIAGQRAGRNRDRRQRGRLGGTVRACLRVRALPSQCQRQGGAQRMPFESHVPFPIKRCAILIK